MAQTRYLGGMSKPALGKGLGALIQGGIKPAAAPVPAVASPEPSTEKGERIEKIPVSEIEPNRYQPRREFKEEELAELAESIKTHGILQPIIIRRQEGGKFELVSGERRWRATRKLNLETIPAIIRNASDEQLAELALIENIQREALNPIEEAEAYQRLVDTFSLRQEDVATRVGKSRAAVTNALRLLTLDAQVRALVSHGHLSVGHAKVLLGLPTAAEQRLASEQIIRQSLNVRQTETLVTNLRNRVSGSAKSGRGSSKKPLSSQLQAIEKALQQKFSTKVHLQHSPKKGSILIEYYGDDDLNRILDQLNITL